MTGRATIIC